MENALENIIRFNVYVAPVCGTQIFFFILSFFFSFLIHLCVTVLGFGTISPPNIMNFNMLPVV